MTAILVLYLFVLGLALGSFALVLADRMKTGKDWVRGRSKCDDCGHKLLIKDLIPLFSWFSTKGKCRYCKTSLSTAYPLTEAWLGIAFAASYLLWPFVLNNWFDWLRLVVWLTALVIMTGLIIFDFRWYLLPNKLIYPLIATSVIWAGFDVALVGFSADLIITYLLAVLVSAGLFFFLYIISTGKWIGDGDVRLGIAIGLFVGSWPLAWLTVFLASILGLFFSLLYLRKSKGKRLKVKIPFGPMLIVSTIVVVLVGQSLVDWYLKDILRL